MDRMPGEEVNAPIRLAATPVPDVRAIESLFARKVGFGFRVTIHVQADPEMSPREAHVLSGRVERAIRTAVPQVGLVLVHMESIEPDGAVSTVEPARAAHP
ncbi:MAG TPA: cation transporter dimerization domain-containing protein [Longimicrobiaceae bacterium]|nr:cation transporter dimerization domain-containing protein [Longimicrobiaceae bacterium]